MNNKLRITAVIAALLIIGGATAQHNVKKAMDDLLNDKAAVKVKTQKYEHDMGGEEETYCYQAILQLDKTQANKMIARVEEAFDKDGSAAYYTMYQTPKIQAESIKILYGPDQEYSVTFGAYQDHNYRMICTEDPDHAGKRHSYAMVWYNQDGGVRCLLYQIYGRRPGKKSGMKLTSLENYLKTWPEKWANSTTIVDDNQIRIITGDNQTRIDRIVADTGIGNIADDTDFLLLFGNLRAAFLDAIKDPDKKVLQTGIALKLLKLCKTHANLLSSRETMTCKESLQEMKRVLEHANPDTFINGVLQEAYTALQ